MERAKEARRAVVRTDQHASTLYLGDESFQLACGERGIGVVVAQTRQKWKAAVSKFWASKEGVVCLRANRCGEFRVELLGFWINDVSIKRHLEPNASKLSDGSWRGGRGLHRNADRHEPFAGARC